MNFRKFEALSSPVGRTSDILQIACVCGTESFNVYMKPTCCNISISASEATGSYTEFIVSRNNFVIVPYKVFTYHF